MNSRHRVAASFLFVAAIALLSAPLRADESSRSSSVDFAREVLPILSDKCFACHGPGAEKKDFLRLDSFEGATSDRGGYRAIDSSEPKKSEVLVRIHDRDDPMPPRKAERQLTDRERAVITRWILSGGKYAEHWAFVPPREAAPRETAERAGSTNPIDAFVFEQLAERGIEFAPEADRATLARRVSLVLTGLPPEPEQLARFLADVRPDAYERLVDELLASPRYGEHQARYWLDAIRYGDTHGLHLDNRRGIYPYRDWVIHAFNDNLPLDRFLTVQLAGDLLPNPSLGDLVATGFVRMNPTTSEGGALPEEFQAKNNFDRTETLGTALLGMTLTCARCHTHKYDPIPQTEYYRLLAFFNSTAERSMDGNSYTYGPVIRAPADQTAWSEWQALESTRAALLSAAETAVRARGKDLLTFAVDSTEWRTKNWRLSAALPASAPAPSFDEAKPIEGLPGALKEKLPKTEEAVWARFEIESTAAHLVLLSFSGAAGSEVWLGSAKVSAVSTHATGERVTEVPLALPGGSHRVRIKMVGAGRRSNIEVQLRNPWTAYAQSKSWRGATASDRLWMLADEASPFRPLNLFELARATARHTAMAESRFTTSLVARDLDQPRPTRLLRRGEYNLPIGEPLEPGILSVMGAFPEDAPRNRLGLARWLTSRDHPLVARVLVNRIWQRIYGDGIVRTPEDFGRQGEQPTHPELLDWLAVTLQDDGWDMKTTIRRMVTSRTFRQSSKRRKVVDDPENRLFARGPSYRLDAEVLRDVGLWASGLLLPDMGGEGVKPYQPDGLWSALAHPASNTKKYVRDKGEKLYRRSIYVYWKRTSPHPMMTLFDAPSRESSCVRRSRTDTSLQSLALFNETQRTEMARVLAGRILRERTVDTERLDLLFGLLACRSPTDVERRACEALLAASRARFTAVSGDAESLLAIGDAPRAETMSAADLAAWTQVTTTVLASDVAILLY